MSQYHVYVEILDLIKSCKIIKNNNHGLIIEIDSEENRRRVEEKIGHGYEAGNLFIKLLIHRF